MSSNPPAYLSSAPMELISKGYFGENRVVKLPVKRDGESIEVRTEDITGGEYRIPDLPKKHLTRISQLGLKELWLGGVPKDHSRWEHSIGTLNAGLIWLKCLEQDGRVPKHCLNSPLDSWNKIQATLGTAMLLHDYGHLPFAHLIEEVLEHINWLPTKARASGLETAVLETRLKHSEFNETWAWLINSKLGIGTSAAISSSGARRMIEELILGRFGSPWLQTIVNSPIDADKIDYLRYDSDFLSRTDFSVHHRLQQTRPTQWLVEFLRDQDVNHAGILMLHGRSALAAADLLRERIHMYDRVYLAPDLRIPDRMAFEIIQQFLIRATMSSGFLKPCGIPNADGFAERFFNARQKEPCSPANLIALKYEAVRDIMESLLGMISGVTLEFPLLEKMVGWLKDCKGIDPEYVKFLDRCFACLKRVSGEGEQQEDLRRLVRNTLVREPLLLHSKDFYDARDILRNLQHTYSREVLIDIVRMPRVLSSAGRFATSDSTFGRCHAVLVPDGPVETWSTGKRATCLLTDACVRNLELPYCRVSVIAPMVPATVRSRYIWDRVRASLLESGIEILSRSGGVQ